MFPTAFSFGGLLATAVATVLLTAEPAQAAPRGRYHYGYYHGGYRSGYYRPYYYGGYRHSYSYYGHPYYR